MKLYFLYHKNTFVATLDIMFCLSHSDATKDTPFVIRYASPVFIPDSGLTRRDKQGPFILVIDVPKEGGKIQQHIIHFKKSSSWLYDNDIYLELFFIL